jgi:hypothetical protein
VPPRLRLRLVLGRPQTRGGWIVFAIGMIFCAIFIPRTDISWGYDGRTSGRVTDVRRTRAEENDREVYAVQYAYSVPGGAERRGTSYTTDPPASGAVVAVDLDSDRPSRSRIVGMRSAPFGVWALGILLIPVASLAVVVWSVRQGRRDAALLEVCEAASGRVLSTWSARDSDGDEIHHAMVEFAHARGTTTASIHRGLRRDLEIGESLTILYDPRCPADNRVARELAGRPRLDGDGALRFEGGSLVLDVAIPLVAGAVAVGSLLMA